VSGRAAIPENAGAAAALAQPVPAAARRARARASFGTAQALLSRGAPSASATTPRAHGACLAWLWQTRARGRSRRGVVRAISAAFVLMLTSLGGVGDRALHALLPRIRERGELVALLRDDVPAAERDALVRALLARPRVSSVRVVGSHEALARLEAELGDRAGLLDNVEEGFLPPSLEIGVEGGPGLPADVMALAARLRASPLVTDVDVWRGAADPRTETWLGATRIMRAGLIAFGAVAVGALSLALLRWQGARAAAEARLCWLYGVPRLIVGGWEALSMFAGLSVGVVAGSVGLLALVRSPSWRDLATTATLTGSLFLACAWAAAMGLAKAVMVTRAAR